MWVPRTWTHWKDIRKVFELPRSWYQNISNELSVVVFFCFCQICILLVRLRYGEFAELTKAEFKSRFVKVRLDWSSQKNCSWSSWSYGRPIILYSRAGLCEDFPGAFAKSSTVTFSFALSVRPRGTTRLPLDGFSWNLIFEYFWKMCRENSSSMKMATIITGCFSWIILRMKNV